MPMLLLQGFSHRLCLFSNTWVQLHQPFWWRNLKDNAEISLESSIPPCTVEWNVWTCNLLLLSRFSRVRLCATPYAAAHHAFPSLGFSRQEHWSGLPFPSPMYESEKWTWSRSVVSDFATPWTAAYQAPPSMGFSRQECWSGLPLPSPNMQFSNQ